MRKKINILTACYAVFIILLFASGLLGSMPLVSKTVYFLAFVLPIAFVLFALRKDNTPPEKYLSLKKGDAKKLLPLITPTVSLVILTSYLTSVLIFALTGKTNSVNLGDSYILAMINYAVLPALLEEALFRYLPMRLIAPHSRSGAVLVSAFFFFLVHQSLFSIPYAFIAGVVFMAIDIAFDSVVPSVIIHFVNNAISVGMIMLSDNPAFAPVIYTVLGLLTLVSIAVLILSREKYKNLLKSATEKGEGIQITAEMMIFGIVTISIAVINLV